jgi:hypothetical protein
VEADDDDLADDEDEDEVDRFDLRSECFIDSSS